MLDSASGDDVDLGIAELEEPLSTGFSCGQNKGCSSRCADCQVRLLAVCSALDQAEITDLERISHQISLPARTALFLAGDPARHVFTVTAGYVRLQRDLPDGRRQVIGFAMPGDFIGLAMDEQYGFSADALTPAMLCRFERPSFTELAQQRTGLLTRLREVAAHELGLAQEHMVVLGRRRAEERVAAFLIRWHERMFRLNGKVALLELPMGRQDIADYLGLTIETVSRTLTRWMRDRIILDVPGGLRILDEARLKAVLAN
jgi:CRP/FNR family transcriptional regulator, anaerobic regulatory protein